MNFHKLSLGSDDEYVMRKTDCVLLPWSSASGMSQDVVGMSHTPSQPTPLISTVTLAVEYKTHRN